VSQAKTTLDKIDVQTDRRQAHARRQNPTLITYPITSETADTVAENVVGQVTKTLASSRSRGRQQLDHGLGDSMISFEIAATSRA